MNTTWAALAAVVGIPAAVAAASLSLADDDRDERRLAVATGEPGYARYREECGSCHLAYPPGLLSAPQWNRVLDNLADHYGDNAELDAPVRERIRAYLTTTAPGPAQPTAPLPRITTQRWFLHEHDELPARMVTGNPEVGAFSNCAACHRDAAAGRFDEDAVTVPGYPRWD